VPAPDDVTPIGTYTYIDYRDPAQVIRPWDPRAPVVASRLVRLIGDAFPAGTVEHIGSTAIPGCDGKGVIDLMLLYDPGDLAAARDALDGLGFQRHETADAFPETRPVRIGTIDHDGDSFRVHVHVLAIDDPEVARQRHFRDSLRADPGLVAAYVADKRRIAGTPGLAGGGAYAEAKGAFIGTVNATAGTPDSN
jgi:dephospho-CoA kinase